MAPSWLLAPAALAKRLRGVAGASATMGFNMRQQKATLTLPPAPLAAEPVRSTIAPELPFFVVPVVNDSEPLTPFVPASAVRTLNTPLDDARP